MWFKPILARRELSLPFQLVDNITLRWYTGIYWGIMGYMGVYGGIWGVYWGILGYTGIYRGIQGYAGVYWVYRNIQGYAGVYWVYRNILGYTGVYRGMIG